MSAAHTSVVCWCCPIRLHGVGSQDGLEAELHRIQPVLGITVDDVNGVLETVRKMTETTDFGDFVPGFVIDGHGSLTYLGT